MSGTRTIAEMSSTVFEDLFRHLINSKFIEGKMTKLLPKSKFNIGDWVCHEYVIDTASDPRYGQKTRLLGYITGKVHAHPELHLTDADDKYGYYVRFVYQDGFMGSRVEDELFPGKELKLWN